MILTCSTLLLALSLLAPQSVGGTPLQQIRGRVAFDRFGQSVAVAGDLNHDGHSDFLVGSPDADQGGFAFSGAVQAYSGADGSILFHWEGSAELDQFGRSVANAGDTNNDGTNDILIGAPLATVNGIVQTGRVTLYSGADGSLLQQWNGAVFLDHFGDQVANAGDIDGDGFPDILIAAPWASKPGTLGHHGAIYVYSGATGALLFERFGQDEFHHGTYHVSGLGDTNQDGFDDFLLGASLIDDRVADRVGFITVFSGLDGTELFRRQLDVGPHYLVPVASTGDINGDSIPDFMFGHDGGIPQGMVSMISGIDGSLIRNLLPPPNGGFYFGQSLANTGDVDGDGVNDCILGFSQANWGRQEEPGSAMIYSGSNGRLIRRLDSFQGQSFFGHAVAGNGDFNADGSPDVLIGALGFDSGPDETVGAVFAYSLKPTLSKSVPGISAARGGLVDLALDFPAAEANHDYIILMSKKGLGLTHKGVDIPLATDTFLLNSVQGIYPFPGSPQLHGTLDANAQASVQIDFPAGLAPSWVGRHLWLAAISMPAGRLPTYSSETIPLQIFP
ncbi:MAG: integrin alpha [Planctomycetota bacterium]